MDSLWHALEEPTINIEDFEDVFSKVPLKKKEKPEKAKSTRKTKEVGSIKPNNTFTPNFTPNFVNFNLILMQGGWSYVAQFSPKDMTI